MKRLIWFLFLFFFPCIYSQDLPASGEFPIGVFAGDQITDPVGHETLLDLGVNYVVYKADGQFQSLLAPFNIIAAHTGPNDPIHHYTNGIYTKWEAEENVNSSVTGYKHTDGYKTYYKGDSCWASPDLSSPVEGLVKGPNYFQEKKYMRLQYAPYYNQKISFKVKFRIAFDNTPQVPENTELCRLYVRHGSNKIINSWYSDIYVYHDFEERTLNVSDFPDDNFREFEIEYVYPDSLVPNNFKLGDGYPALNPTVWLDDISNTGIEFCIDWNGIGKLYVDYVEVKDPIGEELFQPDTLFVKNRILNYLSNYNEWNNIKYWYVRDEPHSIDYYQPLNLIEQWVSSYQNGKYHTITEMYPNWDGFLNGDLHIKNYVSLAKPFKLMIDYYPFTVSVPVPTYLSLLQGRFQEAALEDPNFWYVGQGFGQVTSSGQWCGWRLPDSSELKASAMLALAHGSKGLIFWKYFTEDYWDLGANCAENVKTISIVGEGPAYEKSDLWYMLKNLNYRLQSEYLGKKLLQLNYTGNFKPLRYLEDPSDNPGPVIYDYLTIYSDSSRYNWHVGFLKNEIQYEDRYFMLVNLYTTADQSVTANVSKPVGNYQNYRFRDVEGSFDTTFTTQIIKDLFHDRGEGKLYQVAPVIKYGGRLILNESTTDGITLNDDMIIENGAVLSINGTYNASGNIYIKNGSIVFNQNSKINFLAGKKLIVTGNALVQGNSSNKLELDFITTNHNSGIVIEHEGSLTLNNCIIKNAALGIESKTNAGNLYVSYVNFIDCGTHSVFIYGKSDQDGFGTPPPSQIINCNITGSTHGILAANLTELVIKQNTITNTEYGIFLENVTNPLVSNNRVTSNLTSAPGIMFLSSSGAIRGNTISGHTNGIHLGNSSPDVGGNIIDDNQFHGMYIGAGSYPNMTAALISDPPVWYALSGYNKISENGGWSVPGPEDNDGSEIYLYSSNVQMQEGCNEITDNRLPDLELTVPLATTILLMNGSGSDPFEVFVDGNFWGTHPLYSLEERFGDLTAYFDPSLLDPCTIPQTDDGLFVTSLSGEVIDTVYPVSRSVGELTNTELTYSTADGKFISADYNAAEVLYNQIISGNEPLKTKLHAYKRLYEIGKIKNKPAVYFENLYSTFSSISQTAEDQLMKKIFKQLGSLSLIGKTEYIDAIEEFDNVIQQNPNTEEAVYAEIDAITTALLVEEDSTTLNKSAAGKYTKSISGGYFNSLDKILRTNFSSNQKPEQIILPKEYLLYQNYPNPFNPVTIIRYDIPDNSVVEVSIFDILGRHIKTLVNGEVKQPGTYEVRFDASGLSSGIYFYRLTANTFTSTKKMMVIK